MKTPQISITVPPSFFSDKFQSCQFGDWATSSSASHIFSSSSPNFRLRFGLAEYTNKQSPWFLSCATQPKQPEANVADFLILFILGLGEEEKKSKKNDFNWTVSHHPLSSILVETHIWVQHNCMELKLKGEINPCILSQFPATTVLYPLFFFFA